MTDTNKTKNYEILKDKKSIGIRTFRAYPIRALRDIEIKIHRFDLHMEQLRIETYLKREGYQVDRMRDDGMLTITIPAGSIGGYISDESQLSQYDDCWIAPNCALIGSVEVSGRTLILNTQPDMEKPGVVFGGGNLKTYTLICNFKDLYNPNGKAIKIGDMEAGTLVVNSNIEGNLVLDGCNTIMNSYIHFDDYIGAKCHSPYGAFFDYPEEGKDFLQQLSSFYSDISRDESPDSNIKNIHAAILQLQQIIESVGNGEFKELEGSRGYVGMRGVRIFNSTLGLDYGGMAQRSTLYGGIVLFHDVAIFNSIYRPTEGIILSKSIIHNSIISHHTIGRHAKTPTIIRPWNIMRNTLIEGSTLLGCDLLLNNSCIGITQGWGAAIHSGNYSKTLDNRLMEWGEYKIRVFTDESEPEPASKWTFSEASTYYADILHIKDVTLECETIIDGVSKIFESHISGRVHIKNNCSINNSRIAAKDFVMNEKAIVYESLVDVSYGVMGVASSIHQCILMGLVGLGDGKRLDRIKHMGLNGDLKVVQTEDASNFGERSLKSGLWYEPYSDDYDIPTDLLERRLKLFELHSKSVFGLAYTYVWLGLYDQWDYNFTTIGRVIAALSDYCESESRRILSNIGLSVPSAQLLTDIPSDKLTQPLKRTHKLRILIEILLELNLNDFAHYYTTSELEAINSKLNLLISVINGMSYLAGYEFIEWVKKIARELGLSFDISDPQHQSYPKLDDISDSPGLEARIILASKDTILPNLAGVQSCIKEIATKLARKIEEEAERKRLVEVKDTE